MFLVKSAVHTLVGEFCLKNSIPEFHTDTKAYGAELVVMLHVVQLLESEVLAEVHGGVVCPVVDLVVALVTEEAA